MSVPARVRHCMNPAKDREMVPNKSVQGPLWPFPSLIPRALKCLCYFNYNNFPITQNFQSKEQQLDTFLHNMKINQ